MANLFESALEYIAKHFRKDASKMLIWTGVAGWTLSSLAQIGAILFNPKIPDEQKGFLVPQETADALVNIGSFFLITQATKRIVSKMFSTGKFAPQKVKQFLDKNPVYKEKVGKLDFKIDDILNKEKGFPQEEYYACKNFGTTLATVGAGILSSNIVTPIIRNNMASRMQKNYLDMKSNTTETPKLTYQPPKNYGLKI